MCPKSESLLLISLSAQRVCEHVCVCVRARVCVRIQVAQIKHRLMQVNMEWAFLHLIKNSVRRIDLESERRQSLQMPRASRVRQTRSEPGTPVQAASSKHKRQASSERGTAGQAASTLRKRQASSGQ